MARLKRRAEFLNAQRGGKQVRSAFILRAGRRPGKDTEGGALTFGVGFTASKRVGNAPARNRAKRRLREAARLAMPRIGVAGRDYVLIARTAVLTYPFAALLTDLEEAVRRIER